MLGSKTLLAAAALAAIPTALANWLPYQNWGCAPSFAPSSERSQCSHQGDYFLQFASRTFCVSKYSSSWQPDNSDDCPLQGWGWHRDAKCCVPPKEVAECDCGEGYTWNAAKHKCVANTGCPPTHWYCDRQKECLPNNPPPDDECPKPKYCPTGWRWDRKTQKCKPKHKRTPKPDCDDWSDSYQCCQPNPSPSQYHPPGGGYGGGGYGGGGYGGGGYGGGGYGGGGYGGQYKKRLILAEPETVDAAEVLKRDQIALNGMYCPMSLTACPVSSKDSVVSPEWSYECLDTQRELESCGGCVSKGEGTDCTLIPNAKAVGCSEGKCQLFTCFPGFANNGTSCNPL